MSHGEIILEPKKQIGRLKERLTFCVEPELKEEFHRYVTAKTNNGPELVRVFIRRLVEAAKVL